MLSIMKTFLNVLYRRILYKIPLKLLLVLLAIFWLLFACTKADLQVINSYDLDLQWQYRYSNSNWDFVCVVVNSCTTYWSNWVAEFTVSNTPNRDMIVKFNWQVNNTPTMNKWMWYCWDEYIDITTWYNCSLSFKTYKAVDYTSLQCQSEYSLIPISEVDSSYCQSNNLCPSWWTPSDCPNVWVSNLFINDIFHPGAFNIIMNIPEEISRDYAYTNSWYNFNLDIEWYNVDYEKMQSVIDKQSYIPTNEDFQNIILLIWPYWKIIIFFVFLFILWAWIKKPFKSKL